MSCAMIYWNQKVDEFYTIFKDFGAVVDIRALHDQPSDVQRDLLQKKDLGKSLGLIYKP